MSGDHGDRCPIDISCNQELTAQDDDGRRNIGQGEDAAWEDPLNLGFCHLFSTPRTKRGPTSRKQMG